MNDPFKQKSVPLAAETVLWFEFLLDTSLLSKHLKKNNPDPSAIDLINQFISMSPEQLDLPTPVENDMTINSALPVLPSGQYVSTIEGLKMARKRYDLKILTLKVATQFKWNLDILQKNLPMQKQIILLRDLCTLSCGRLVNIPLDIDTTIAVSEGSEKALKFALTLYHRWVLRFASEIPTEPSVLYLTQLRESLEPFYIFTFDSFNIHLRMQTFEEMLKIPTVEVRAQICFDLVNFYLFSKQYDKARDAVLDSKKNFDELKALYDGTTDFPYCSFNESDLEGCLAACGVRVQVASLIDRFNVSLLNNYQGIIPIFKEDNLHKEIPFVNRRIVELDVEGAISQGILKESREFEMKIAALNLIRGIFDKEHIFENIEYFEKYKMYDCFLVVIEGIVEIFQYCSMSDRNIIKEFLVNCILQNSEGRKLFINHLLRLNIFSITEIEDLKLQTTEEKIFIPALSIQTDWKGTSNNPRIEIGALERQLICCSNATAVRKLLVKLASTNPAKPLWTVNPSWQVPTAINALLMAMPRGFLQDFAYVLSGKSREMVAKNDFVGAVQMMSVLRSESQRPEVGIASVKLGKLVTYEILLIQICQCLNEWNKKSLDLSSLGSKCKQCLNAVQGNDGVIPRIEILEHCAIMLLNLADWNSIMVLDKRLKDSQVELTIAFAATFLEMEKLKGSKKIFRDAWDIILTIFSNTTIKRGNNSRSSPSISVSNILQPFLHKIRDQMVFSVVISLLAKMYNVLKDDPNLELNGEYMHLWPTSITNPVGYNTKSLAETLNWLLTEALKYYPQNISWLKIKADLELALGNNEAAMKCYVSSLLTGTENCNIPLQRSIVDDYVIRKMIKCASNMGCYMQALVLSQFLDEIDYSIALKNITEKSGNFTDAMDSYYNCLWDQTLLEFVIALHAKKGETNRKLEAISIMSNFEINPNNNEEIKREAISIRKARFLRALAKQYLL